MSKLGALVRRLGLDNVPLHATATAESLALARILMLAIWIVYVVQDPVQSLTFLPQELFHAFGVFQLVPGTAWAALLTPTGLFALKSVLIGLFAWAMFGFRGARVAAAVALALVFVYLQVKKGFGGHWDHREMTLAYAHFLLLFTPAWDAFAVSRAARRPRREGVYRASLIALSLVVIIQYFFIEGTLPPSPKFAPPEIRRSSSSFPGGAQAFPMWEYSPWKECQSYGFRE